MMPCFSLLPYSLFINKFSILFVLLKIETKKEEKKERKERKEKMSLIILENLLNKYRMEFGKFYFTFSEIVDDIGGIEEPEYEKMKEKYIPFHVAYVKELAQLEKYFVEMDEQQQLQMLFLKREFNVYNETMEKELKKVEKECIFVVCKTSG